MCNNNPKCENRAGTCRCNNVVKFEVGKKYVDRAGNIYELVVDARGKLKSGPLPLGFISQREWQFRYDDGRINVGDSLPTNIDVVAPYVPKRKVRNRGGGYAMKIFWSVIEMAIVAFWLGLFLVLCLTSKE